MKKRTDRTLPHSGLALALLLAPACVFAQAADASRRDAQLPAVEVKASNAGAPVDMQASDGYPSTRINQAGIEALAGPAQTNAFRTLDSAPSVNFTATDAYGITVDQNFLRIRGISGYTYSNLAANIEGTPSAVSAGQGAVGNLFDMENVEAVSLLRGPMPVNAGFGLGNLAGSTDLRLRRPAETFGGQVRLSAGSDSFSKAFARVDSGRFGGGSRAFLSVSDAQADKWTGPGEQSRNTVNVGFSQAFGRDVSFDLFAAQSRFKRDEYRPLSSTQLGNFEDYYDEWDYTARLTGDPAKDGNYYRYNSQEFEENNIIGVLTWRLSDDTRFQFRPYWVSADGVRYTGKSPTVTKVDNAQEQLGAVAELTTRVAGQQLVAGYWNQRLQSMPPPMAQKTYTINKDGSLGFSKWNILSDMGSREFHSPYARLSGEVGKLRYDAGLRFLHEYVPGITSYNGASVADMGRLAAIDSNPPVNAALTTTATSFNIWLPSFSLRWDYTPELEGRVAYGRGMGNPWMGPLYSTFMSNQAAFKKAGISLQKLWNDLELETSDTLETGINWRREQLELGATVFYSKIRDKQVTAYDPAVGVSYLQSGVKATAWGLELEGNWRASSALTLFGSLSYNVNKLDDDLMTGSGTVLATSGKQVTDTPKWMLKAGVDYRTGPFRVGAMARHVGERYGDAYNAEKVDAYTTADLYASWKIGRYMGTDWETSLSVQNVFDEKYIGSINQGKDDARPGELQYYLGAPRSVALSLNARF